MKYLVTGGAGFIGSHIVDKLLYEGHDVKILDNLSTGFIENVRHIKNDIEIIEGDIRSYHHVISAMEGIEIVIHLAALPSVPRSITDPISSNEVNITGTLNILNACVEKKVRRIIYASSSSVYGDNTKLPKTEKMVGEPLSPYAVSKFTCEKYLRVFNNLYGLETIALRYFNVFGPRQNPFSQYSAVIPKFIDSILNDKSPNIYGDGTQSRDFTYINNIAEANYLASTSAVSKPLVLNCAANNRITLNELLKEINRVLGKEIQAVYQSRRSGDILHSYASIEEIKKELGYKVLNDFKYGIKKTIEYYQKQTS